MNPSRPASPPRQLCLLRTSALGDVTHVAPIVHTLRRAWPESRLTWIIGKLEGRLIGDLPGVDFVVFDKTTGWRGWCAVRDKLRSIRFDALLHLQVALRANLLSLAVRADRRIGYDRARARDLHGLFVNTRIEPRSGQHVLDAMASFLEPLGLRQTEVRWDLPIPDEAREWARAQLPGEAPTLLVSPCSSHRVRTWNPARYAAVADHAAQRFGMRLVLCGGPSTYERDIGNAILEHLKSPALDLTAKDTLKQLLALLQRASLVLAPDAGPMHMANAVGTPVLGLHAASNPERSGPYSDRRWCVNRYDDAARHYVGKPADELPWGTKIEKTGVMDLVSVDDAIGRLEAFAAHAGLS